MTTGCETCQKYSLTYKLLTAGEMRNFYGPAPSTDLQLYEVPDRRDVLVMYNEVSEKNGSIRRRAYLLYANIHRIRANHKPRFVNPRILDEMTPIVVRQTVAATSSRNDQASVYATARTNCDSFMLYTTNGEQGPYELPTYRFKGDVVSIIALIPFAVVGDTLIFGGMTAILFLPAWGPALAGRSV